MNIVKNWFKITFSKVFVCALVLLIAVNVVGAITEDAFIMKTVKPFFIPVFLIFFFFKYRYLGIAFISFLLFSFLGDISSMFFSEDVLIKTSSVLYVLSYLYLLMMVAPKFKLLEAKALIGTYLLGVFLIAVYFLYVAHGVLSVVVSNKNEVLLFVIKNFTFIILTFVSFGVYLNTQTKQSALFLTAVVFFGLSVMLNYVTLYYLDSWGLELLDRVLYATALYVMFIYIMNKEVLVTKPKEIQLKDRYPSDTVLS